MAPATEISLDFSVFQSKNTDFLITCDEKYGLTSESNSNYDNFGSQ